MSEQKVTGSCLCNKARYEITGNMGVFQYCHCSRCRKITGSSGADWYVHASTLPENEEMPPRKSWVKVTCLHDEQNPGFYHWPVANVFVSLRFDDSW